MGSADAPFDEFRALLLAAVAETASDPGSTRWRGVLEGLLRHVWSLHGRMDSTAARRGLDALRPALQRARRAAPAEPDGRPPDALTALEEASWALEVATVAAKPLALLQELRSHPETSTKRAVLELMALERRFMRRGEIRSLLRGHGRSLTGQRVGQVLAELHRQGFLFRHFGAGRGAREIAFYALSDAGRAVWAEAEQDRSPRTSALERFGRVALMDSALSEYLDLRADDRTMFYLVAGALRVASAMLASPSWSTDDVWFARLLCRFPLGGTRDHLDDEAVQIVRNEWSDPNDPRIDLMAALFKYQREEARTVELLREVARIGTRLVSGPVATLWSIAAANLVERHRHVEEALANGVAKRALELLSRDPSPVSRYWRAELAGEPDEHLERDLSGAAGTDADPHDPIARQIAVIDRAIHVRTVLNARLVPFEEVTETALRQVLEKRFPGEVPGRDDFSPLSAQRLQRLCQRESGIVRGLLRDTWTEVRGRREITDFHALLRSVLKQREILTPDLEAQAKQDLELFEELDALVAERRKSILYGNAGALRAKPRREGAERRWRPTPPEAARYGNTRMPPDRVTECPVCFDAWSGREAPGVACAPRRRTGTESSAPAVDPTALRVNNKGSLVAILAQASLHAPSAPAR